MDKKEQYISVISEIIAKQAIILGPKISVLKARNVTGLIVSDNGEVSDINGDPASILQSLIDEYIALSGQIVKNVIKPIFKKYPELEETVNRE